MLAISSVKKQPQSTSWCGWCGHAHFHRCFQFWLIKVRLEVGGAVMGLHATCFSCITSLHAVQTEPFLLKALIYLDDLQCSLFTIFTTDFKMLTQKFKAHYTFWLYQFPWSFFVCLFVFVLMQIERNDGKKNSLHNPSLTRLIYSMFPVYLFIFIFLIIHH